jgi:hypothetical protein
VLLLVLLGEIALARGTAKAKILPWAKKKMERRYSVAIVVAALFIAAAVLNLGAAPPNSASAANLTILVPLKMGFNEFVNWSSPDRPVRPNSAIEFSGFSVEVFRECIKHLDHSIDYTLVPFGDGINDPSYVKIVEKLVSGVYSSRHVFSSSLLHWKLNKSVVTNS